MIWAILQVGGRQLTSLLVFAILGVLLAPRDFGLVGMAMAWLSIVQSFSDLGLGAALMQRREIGQAHFSTVFLLNVGVGVALTLVGAGLSWPAAWFFHEPALQPVAIALSLNFLVGSVSAAQAAVAQRELRFRRLAIRDVAGTALGGGAGIGLAAAGWGVWSLVAQSSLTGLAAAVLIWPLLGLAAEDGRILGALFRRDVARTAASFSCSTCSSRSSRTSIGCCSGTCSARSPWACTCSPTGSWCSRSPARGRDGHVSVPLSVAPAGGSAALRRAYGDAMRGLAAVALPVAMLAGVGGAGARRQIGGDRWAAAIR